MDITGEKFDYLRCQRCDTLQIAVMPDDMAPYYGGDNYYSFAAPKLSLKERVKEYFDRPAWIKGVAKSARILDFGSGGGTLLAKMRRQGYSDLTGYDPFAEPADGSIRITNKLPQGQFDVVMMHHSLEHVPQPNETLQTARKLLKGGGKLIVRIPVRQGEAWRLYGHDWVHLDPPRHFYLWTVDGFTRMAGDNGFRVTTQGFDTTFFAYAGSEMVKSGVPHRSGVKWNVRDSQRAEAANKRGDADSAWFVLS